MPPNDVVRHDLNVAARFTFDGETEPMPIPLISRPAGLRLALANPPTTTMITDPTIDTGPYSSVGKMGIKFNPLQSLSGSGWVIAPRAFITAGHCVYFKDYSGWIEQGVFCPRYNLECEKLYTVETVFTLQGWITTNDAGDDKDRQYDMAACVVTEAFSAAEPPLAFEVNSLPGLQYAAIGYPGKPIPAHQFNGKRMWQSVGAMEQMTGGMIWAENDLTTGASGGPWCEPQSNWVVSGLTAARITDDPNLAVSPYFTQGFQNLYDAVKNL